MGAQGVTDRSKIDEDELYDLGDAGARFYAVLDGITKLYAVVKSPAQRVLYFGFMIYASGSTWGAGGQYFRGWYAVSILSAITSVVLFASATLAIFGMKDNGDFVFPFLERAFWWLWLSAGPLMLITMVAMFITDPPLR